jgi:hypothetical protein
MEIMAKEAKKKLGKFTHEENENNQNKKGNKESLGRETEKQQLW